MPASRTTHLTTSSSTFVGRSIELRALRRLVDTARLVTLVGAGGCGKTRLALELCQGAGADSALGQATVVDLAPVTEEDPIAAVLLDAIGGRNTIGQDPLARVVDHLAGAEPVALLIDNCEHVIEDVALTVDRLIAQLPGLLIVATSREPLGLPGESVYRVPPMGLPGAEMGFSEARSADAVRLFVERAASVRPDYEIAGDDGSAAIEICRRLDGLPLAIELAAARLTVFSPTAIAAGLDDRFRLLTGGSRAARPRHQTLQACVEWSYALLDSDEQHLLDLLSIFRDGFNLDAVEAVAGKVIAEDRILDLVDQLVQKSLVLAAPAPGGSRFDLIETITAFAAGRLASRAEVVPARREHLEYFRWFVADHGADRVGVDSTQDLCSLSEEQANIRAALEFAFDLVADDELDPEVPWRIVGGLTFFWSTRGRFTEARQWFERCVAGPAVPVAAQLPARWGAAHIALYGGDFDYGLAAGAETLELAERIGDQRYAARALNSLGTVELFFDVAAGLDKQARAIELATEAGDEWCLADALQVVSYAQLFRGEFEAASSTLERARPIAERLDHPLLLAWDRIGQALVAVYRGSISDARAALDDACQQTARTNDPNLSMNLLIAQSWTAYLCGTGDEWVDRFEQALYESGTIGAGEAAPLMAPHVASMLIGLGETDRAHRVLATFLDVTIGFTPTIAPRALQVAAVADLAHDDLKQAQRHFDEALTTLGANGTAVQNAALNVTGALVWALIGDHGRAEAATLQALPVLVETGVRPALIDGFDVLALVLAAKDNMIDAARAAGTSERLRRDTGIAWTELEVFTHATVAAIRGLDEPDIRAAYESGLNATLADSIAYASRTRGTRRRPSLGWNSLTPTELRITTLVADGLTNNQIAERLYVSPETIKTHLSNIYTKLDVRNRVALTAIHVRSTPNH